MDYYESLPQEINCHSQSRSKERVRNLNPNDMEWSYVYMCNDALQIQRPLWNINSMYESIKYPVI